MATKKSDPEAPAHVEVPAPAPATQPAVAPEPAVVEEHIVEVAAPTPPPAAASGALPNHLSWREGKRTGPIAPPPPGELPNHLSWRDRVRDVAARLHLIASPPATPEHEEPK